MKKDTVEKANELLERLSHVDFLMMVTSGLNKKINMDDPGVLVREFHTTLTEKDSEELKRVIEKFLKAKKAKLQIEFDNLK